MCLCSHVFQLCAIQLYFSVQVQGAPPPWSVLMGKLEMGICKVNHRPCCYSWSWDVTGSHPNSYTLFILNYPYPQLPPWQVLLVMEPPAQSLTPFHLYAHHASFGELTMKAGYGYFMYLIAHHLLCGEYFLVAITV